MPDNLWLTANPDFAMEQSIILSATRYSEWWFFGSLLLHGLLHRLLNSLLHGLLHGLLTSIGLGSSQQFEGVNIDLSDISLNGIAIFPHARAQVPLDVELCALADIFLSHLGIASPHDNVVPLGALGNLNPIAVGKSALSRSQRERGHRLSLRHIPHFRVTPHMSQENYFIN